ncbi:MAG: hypothetical protein IKC09_03375 [Oscillospiraceae bacterium]|nr:hypothetical protein [Oscillospiraceae bacterium]
MKGKGQIILAILLSVAVLGYTVYNYVNGRTDLWIMMSAFLIVGLPLINSIRLLIEEIRKKS